MVKHLTKDTFQSVIDQDKLVMVDFWAEWCGPCRMLTPVLDELATSIPEQVEICKVNTDVEQELAMRYNISSIPCVIYFKKGEPLRMSLGFKPRNSFVDEIQELNKL